MCAASVFQPGCHIVLQQGALNIQADSTIFISSTDVKALFRFNHQSRGYYNLIANNPGGALDTLFNAFQLQAPRQTHLALSVAGSDRARTYRTAKNIFTFTNEGNQTIFMLPVYVLFPTRLTFLFQ
jgi:hypothetical protein